MDRWKVIDVREHGHCEERVSPINAETFNF